jgi:CheY-like chemotaxis protein
VDDEAIVRESFQDWLEDAGYQVTVAESGEEALEILEKQDFSVMVLDIRLPSRAESTIDWCHRLNLFLRM